MMKEVWLILSLFWLGQSVEGYMNSIKRLSLVLEKEPEAVTKTNELIEKMRHEMKVLESYVDAYRDIQSKGLSPTDLVSHPINGYIIMKRLVKGWENVEKAKQKIQELIQDAGVTLKNYPSEREMQLSALSIVNMQDMFELDAHMLSEGTIQDPQRNDKVYKSLWKLSASDCESLGDIAEELERHGISVDWYRIALEKNTQGDKSTMPEDVRLKMTQTMQKHDEILHKQGPVGDNWKTHATPYDEKLAKSDKYKDGSLQTKFAPKLHQAQSPTEELIHSEKLCREETLLPESVSSKLTCKYITNNKPYLYMMPLKLDEQSLEPYIVIFRNFVSEDEVEHFLNLAASNLNTSNVYPLTEDSGFIRTADVAWLKDTETIDVVTRRIEMATKTEIQHETASENYQVANYGIGGQFVTHNDYLQESEGYKDTFVDKFVGDRLATLMIYLTDVDAGGATVFPRAGVSLVPQRGSAAFWWNLYRNGEGDENLTHAGCPVLHGTKWISNKWIRAHRQMLTTKCDTHPLTRFGPSFWSSGYSI